MPIDYWQVLAVAIVAAALLEARLAHHSPRGPTVRRIIANSVFLVVGALLASVLVPASAQVDHWWRDSVGAGLIPQLPDSAPIAMLLAFLGYDLQRYVAHRFFHARPLWRLHALHHSDVDVDWSTNFRHHPFEAIAAVLFAAVGVGLLGIAPETIASLAIAHLAWDVFVHSNIALPRAFERALGWLFVTPSMHRVHHSAKRAEADSNFGGMLSIWDRLFGTFRVAEPRRFGLDVAEPSAQGHIPAMLLLPFASSVYQAVPEAREKIQEA